MDLIMNQWKDKMKLNHLEDNDVDIIDDIWV